MSKNRRIKKVVTVVTTSAMIASMVPVSTFTSALAPVQYAMAEELNQEVNQDATKSTVRESIWGSNEVGEHEDKGAYVYDKSSGSITVTGSGSKFDKDSGKDSYYYAYCQAKGDITFTAKMKADGTKDSKSQAGIVVRNAADEATSQSEALYADFSKNQIRYGRHGNGKNGANPLGSLKASDEVYLKIEIKANGDKTKVYYYVSSQADFADAVTAVKGEELNGVDAKTVGFFATAGTTATFSDINVKESYTDEDGTVVDKIVYDSAIGELSLANSTSADYSGKYVDGNEFITEADGNILKVTQVRSKSDKGNIREDKSVNYMLFPTTTDDMTIKADVTIKSVDSGTDKQGFAIGEFSTEKGSITAVDVLHYQKNKVFQHTYSTDRGKGNCGDPKTSADLGSYTVTYTKKDNKADYKVVSASGDVLLDSAAAGTTIDLTAEASFEGLQSGKPVQYGFAFTGIETELSNVKLINANGEVVYDMNDYYIAVGEAPQIAAPVVKVADDRESIELSWDVTAEGSGNIKYSVYVSKDGADYTKVADSKVNSFSYKGMNGDGKYSFKVVPYGGDTKGTEAVTNEVSYQTPLAKTTVKATADSEKVIVTWDEVEGATSYEVYKSYGRTGEKAIVATVAEPTYVDKDVKAEEPYYYYVVAKNADNSSNPSDTVQALTSNGHASEYVYEQEAAKLEVVSKDNDTVFADKTTIAMKSDKAGTAKVIVNGKETGSVNVEAGKQFSFDVSLNKGRNDVEVLLTDENKKITRKTFNYISNPDYDIVVDAAYTGEEGALVDGHATYKTVQAAVNSVAADNAESKVIFIKNGEYEERVEVKSPNVSLLGEDAEKTHLFYSVCIANGNADSMWNRNAMYVDTTAEGFTAENLTIENSYAYTNGNDQQADALCIVADKTSFVNVRLVGYQDTLLTDSRVKDENGNYKVTRQYFEKCYITGNVDFIYGAGTSVFKDCDIVARYTQYKEDGCYTAGRTYGTTKYGYVFDGCRFLAEEGVKDGVYRMARPWGADDSTTFINCYLGRAISTESGKSYGDMSGNLAANARFAEYGSYGPGYVVDDSRPLLTSKEVEDYTLANVMGDYDAESVMNSLYGQTSKPAEKPTEEIKPEEVKPDVTVDQKNDETPVVKVDVDSDAIELTEDEKAAVKSGEKINIKVAVTNKDNTIDAAEKESVEKKVADAMQGAVIGQYIDIELTKQIGNKAATTVYNTKKALEITITLPDSLVNKDATKTRKYSIARVHDGNVEIISGADVVETEVDGNKVLTFASDKFSTYAIVYQDVENATEQPTIAETASTTEGSKSDSDVATGDVNRTGLFAIMAAIAGGLAAFAGKRKKEEE